MARRTDGADWLTSGRTYDEQRFSPLDQINDANVGQLGLAWYARARHRPRPGSDAAGGRRRALHHHRLDQGQRLSTRRPASCSGPTTRKVPARTAGQRLLRRGQPRRRGLEGQGLRRHARRAADRAGRRDRQAGLVRCRPPSTSASPTRSPARRGWSKGKVLIGNGGAEYGVRGYVSAYDAETGKQVWRFYTVPGDPAKPASKADRSEKAAKTWTRRVVEVGGGGTVWDTIVYDPGARPGLHRHRQRRALEPAHRAARRRRQPVPVARSSR